MSRFRKATALSALLLCGLLLSACSISVSSNSSPTPSPRTSPTPRPSPTPKPVSVVMTYQDDTGHCQTSAHVTVLIGGNAVGTMSVDSHAIPTDRLTVMVAPLNEKYSLKGTAFFQANGQSFSLNVTGQGEVAVNPGTNSWNLVVDTSRVATGGCPSGGSTWPMVVQT